MPLEPGDQWYGLDTLRVIDEATGEIVTEGAILRDMDIDPDENVVTITVNGDVGN